MTAMKEMEKRDFPDPESIEHILDDLRYKSDFKDAVKTTIYTLIIIGATALLLATLMFPVLNVHSNAMETVIPQDSIVLTVKNSLPERNDILAFYYNNKILIRRVAAVPGDEIQLSGNMHILVNGERISDRRMVNVTKKERTEMYPFVIPEGKYFVVSDDENIVDSTNQLFGYIVEEDMIGIVKFQLWPLNGFGFVRYEDRSRYDAK